MPRFILAICLLVGAGWARGADASLANARRAQAELGPEIWSEVIRIENEGRARPSPASLHALVFEVGGILWIYMDREGTQSLSRFTGRLEEDKADLTPLLRVIEPALVHWSVVSDGEPALAPRRDALRNGCFIESLAALRARRESGEDVKNARLLSYYFFPGSRQPGHTVLTYATDRGVEVVDPLITKTPRSFPAVLADDPLALAQGLAGRDVAQARWVPVDGAAWRGGIFVGRALALGADGSDRTVW